MNMRISLARRPLLALLAMLLLTMPGLAAAQTETDTVARLIIFHSPTCPHCRKVLEEDMPGIQAQFGDQLEVRLYDISSPEGYSAFSALHTQYPNLPSGVPQAYISEYVLVGSIEIPEAVPIIVEECLANGGCDWSFTIKDNEETTDDDASAVEPEAAASESETGIEVEPEAVAEVEPEAAAEVEPEAAAENAQPVYMAFCFDATCLECDKVNYDLMYLESQYANLDIQRFDVVEDAALIEAMCERYGVPPDERLRTPMIFVDNEYLVPEEIDPTRLTSLIENASRTGSVQPWADLDPMALEAAASQIVERFNSFGALAIIFAGLLDGVNPCAFTTIIFFVSYLAISGRKGKEILMVGAAFTLAVFLTYLALGLGLSAVLKQLGGVSLVGRIIYGVTAVICLALAGLSLWDYRKIRRGELTEIALQLPKVLKDRIRSTIRTRSRMRGFVGAAFVAGVLVSVFELACTGQVYLPTLVFMTGVAETRLSASIYLVLYNLMFVVPLIVVFTITYFGTSSNQLTAVFQSRAGTVKLFTAALFGTLGLWLLYMVLVA